MHQSSFEDWHECRRVMLMWFGKPQVQLKYKYDRQTSPCTHLSRQIQAYGAKQAQRPIVLAVGDMISKQEHVRQWCTLLEPRSMERSSAQKNIYVEVFSKVRDVLNKVHHVKQTDWDVCIPAILWAYRTACKILAA